MPVKVIMPQLGESVVDGTVTRWIKQEGDEIQEFESLLEVETAKVTTEIPSPARGIVLKILVQEGVTVNAGVTLAWIGNAGEQISEDQPENKIAEKSVNSEPVKTEPLTDQIKEGNRDLGFISPVVARLASENNIDLSLVQGSGDRGRITKRDVLHFLEENKGFAVKEQALAPWETPGSGDLFKPTDGLYTEAKPVKADVPVPVEKAPFSSGTLLPLTSKRKAIADHMIRSKQTSAHVTTVMEADLSAVMRHKIANQPLFEKDGLKLTYTPYFVSAASRALQHYPLLNSSWTANGIYLHRDVNIGLAVSLGDEGLIVPVIRQANHLSLEGLTRSINDLADRARSKKLLPDETAGGTFSITNHGTGRSLFATPVINQPQCGILGVGAITKKPVVINDAIAIRPMVYLSLTFDHRIIDGAVADAFLGMIVDLVENWH